MTHAKKNLKKRAFDSVEENDIEELRACLLEGFDINTTRKTKATYYERFLGLPDDIEDSVASLALKNCLTHDTHWAFLRFIFESYSPRSLLQAPAQSFKQSVMTEGLLWSNLASQTFESSDKYFCLWYAFRGNVSDMVSVAPGSIAATGGLFDKANAVNLLLFFKNCIALEEKNALNKPAKKQNSL